MHSYAIIYFDTRICIKKYVCSIILYQPAMFFHIPHNLSCKTDRRNDCSDVSSDGSYQSCVWLMLCKFQICLRSISTANWKIILDIENVMLGREKGGRGKFCRARILLRKFLTISKIIQSLNFFLIFPQNFSEISRWHFSELFQVF